MNLEAINPIVYRAWLQKKEAGPDYYQPSTREQLQKIEDMVDAHFACRLCGVYARIFNGCFNPKE